MEQPLDGCGVPEVGNREAANGKVIRKRSRYMATQFLELVGQSYRKEVQSDNFK